MAQQICPNCRKKAFTWAVYDEYGMTQWRCEACGYQACEDESLVRDCPDCGARGSYLWIIDRGTRFRWCGHCGKMENVSSGDLGH